MLLDLIKELKPDNPLGGNPTGTVVAVDKAAGRIKMIIKGYLEGAVENLPWCYPKNPPDQGGQQDSSHHQMPDLNSELMTSFVGDILHPQYDGKHTSEKTAQPVFQSNPVPMDDDGGQGGQNPSSTGDQGGSGTSAPSSGGSASGGDSGIDMTTLFGKVFKMGGGLAWQRHDKEQGVSEQYHGESKHYNRVESKSGNKTYHIPGRHLINVGDFEQSGGGGGSGAGAGGSGGQGGGGQQKSSSHNVNVQNDDHVVNAKNIVLNASGGIYINTPQGTLAINVKALTAATSSDVQVKSGGNITLGASSGNITGKAKTVEWKGDTVSVDSDSPKVKTPWQTGTAGVAKDPTAPDMSQATQDIQSLQKMVQKLQKQVQALDKQHQASQDGASQTSESNQGLTNGMTGSSIG